MSFIILGKLTGRAWMGVAEGAEEDQFTRSYFFKEGSPTPSRPAKHAPGVFPKECRVVKQALASLEMLDG